METFGYDFGPEERFSDHAVWNYVELCVTDSQIVKLAKLNHVSFGQYVRNFLKLPTKFFRTNALKKYSLTTVVTGYM